MASEQDLTTHGRARLSFASEADIDEFVSVLEKYERGDITPDQWRAFRLVRGTYGQRQAADAQMLRVKIPQGVLTSAAAARARRGRRALLAEVRPHHHPSEHPVSFRQAARRRTGHAPARRRRHDDARGVRKFGAEHHDLPVRGRLGRRGLRRHAVRRGDDAFSAASSTELDAARASSRLRSRDAPRITPSIAINDLAFHGEIGPDGTRGFRVMAGGGTAIMCKSAGIIHEFIARVRDSAGLRSDRCASSRSTATTSTSSATA